MRKIVFLLTLFVAFAACKEKEEIKDLVTLEGEFIYTADAAVLKGAQFIYGVELNDTAQELADQVAPVKRDEFDMVPVIVKGKISKNEGEGWDEKVTIYEIVSVSDTPAEADVKIEDKD